MEKTFKRKLIIIYAMLITSLLFIITSMTGLLKPSDELAEVWFQRSGSIAVALAIFAEIGLVSLTMKNKSLIETMYLQKLERWIDVGEIIAKTMLVLGTVVWGYGDLFHRWLSTLLG